MDWYQEHLVDTGKAAALWLLVAFLATFLITRAITRHIRSTSVTPEASSDATSSRRGGLGDIYIGGVHVHHQVWGIFLVLISGLLMFRYNPGSPWAEVLGALFGIGAALALDEFALWFHVDDVYWSKDGRKSVDAILVGAALAGALLTGLGPSSEEDTEFGSWAVAATLLFNVCFALICIIKGKLATGLIGVIVPIVGIVGAIRLAKPDSYWARRRYGDRRPVKQAKSRARFDESYQARRDRLRDRLGGAPEEQERSAPHA